jgi:uncharacterized protein (TIGR02453 family)
MPAHFTRETFTFLKGLAKNNEKAWFDAHKADYERHVKEPAARFAADVASKLGMEPHVMRIYRDIRFSKDKSPYKTNIGIGLHSGGRVTEGAPGYYLHVQPGESFGAGGLWQPEPPALARIRQRIVDEPAAWAKARKVGLSEDEDALKRVPRGFDPEHKFADDLRRKSFTAGVEFSDADVVRDDFAARYVAAVKKLAPLCDFLTDAIRR